MRYKNEIHRQINISLAEKTKDVPKFISNFLDNYKSAKSKRNYWGYIQDMLQWMIDNKYIKKNAIADITKDDLNKIESNDVIKYLNSLKDGINGTPNSLETVGMKKRIFGAFWRYLYLNRYVTDNIIDRIPKNLYRSEVTFKEVKIPTDKQLYDFLRNIDKKENFTAVRNNAVVQLILGSGIRSEELLNLDMEDLHLEEEIPYIMILGKGKTESFDKVLVSQKAKNIIKGYLSERKVFIEENKIKTDALFVSNDKGRANGNRMSKTAMTSFFNTYSYGEINPHMLRHWVGSTLYKNTKDIVLVQKQLRHKNLETAVRYYVQMSEKTIADAVAVL